MLRDMHLKDGWTLEEALSTMTSTPAATLKLHHKGKVRRWMNGKDCRNQAFHGVAFMARGRSVRASLYSGKCGAIILNVIWK